MQTFLLDKSYIKTAKYLDYRRLGKQRVEVYQILNTLNGVSSGWINHPAVKMWRGYENELVIYGMIMCKEWIARGYIDNLCEKIFNHYNLNKPLVKPKWFNDKRIYESHRSNLLRKMPEHYRQFNWKEPDTLPYFWPINK